MKKNTKEKTDKFLFVKRVLLVLFLLFMLKEWSIYRPLLNLFKTEKISARIIDERNGMRRSQFTGRFVYSYRFEYEGKEYKNKSDNENYRVGEELIVEFNPLFPTINRIYKSRFTN